MIVQEEVIRYVPASMVAVDYICSNLWLVLMPFVLPFRWDHLLRNCVITERKFVETWIVNGGKTPKSKKREKKRRFKLYYICTYIIHISISHEGIIEWIHIFLFSISLHFSCKKPSWTLVLYWNRICIAKGLNVRCFKAINIQVQTIFTYSNGLFSTQPLLFHDMIHYRYQVVEYC